MKSNAMILSVLTAVLLSGCGGRADTVQSETAVHTEETVQTEAAFEVPALDEVVRNGDNEFTCSYEGVKRECILCLPEKTEGAPLIFMLHGYGSSAEGFKNERHFEERANPRGYAVVYVTGSPDPNDATSGNGWNSGISEDGNDDVGFLTALSAYLTEEYSFDRERVFAVGYSNGAFMTHRLAMEASGTFAACVCVSGKMPKKVWDSRNDTNSMGFFQVTGSNDDVVPKNADGSVKFAVDPAIEDVDDYWAASNSAELYDESDIGKKSKLRKYANNDTGKQVWVLDVKDGRHSWFDESVTGIDLDGVILDFLDTQ